MNDDMPWVDLTPEEIQELRTNKQELTEYGKQKIRELMNDGKLRFYDKGKESLTIDDSSWGKCQSPETQLHIKERNTIWKMRPCRCCPASRLFLHSVV